MRTSLNETRDIELYLTGEMLPECATVFEAKLLLDPELARRMALQSKAYDLVRLYGREQLRVELEYAHQELFGIPKHRPFAERILRMFGR